jgi:uncharacterized protein (TIGR03435 family)
MNRGIAGMALALFACAAHGQPAVAKPEFEVASIKPSPPPDGVNIRVGMRGGPGTSDPTRLVVENLNIFALVLRAYEVRPFQIAGADLRDTQRFSITAKIPEGATKAEFRLMLQNLLIERFQLKLHHETKELPIYELTVAKNGPKLKESAGEPPQADISAGMKRDKDGYPLPPPGQMGVIFVNGSLRARLNAANESMPELAKTLTSELERLVVDGTGLKGKYDFVLSWSPETIGGAPSAPSTTPAEDAGPSVFAALQQQLGLKLESKKGPVEILVIDHYEKNPTEN